MSAKAPVLDTEKKEVIFRERERDLESASGEFDADGGLGFEAELVSGESGKEVGFADP